VIITSVIKSIITAGYHFIGRLREKLLLLGPEGLSDWELLAVLLRIGTSGQSAEDLDRQLMSQFNGISGIDRAHIEALLSGASQLYGLTRCQNC